MKRKQWMVVCVLAAGAVIGMLCWGILHQKKEPQKEELSYMVGDREVQIKRAEPLEEKQYYDMCWIDVSLRNIREDVDIAAKGKVSNIREIEISYNNNGSQMTEYSTLFDFTLEEVYKRDNKTEKTITVYYGISSHDYPSLEDDPGMFEVKEGTTYYLFLENLNEEGNDPLGLHHVADYWLLYPHTSLISQNTSEAHLKEQMKIYDSDLNRTAAAEQYFKKDSFTIGDYEAFIKAYFQ